MRDVEDRETFIVTVGVDGAEKKTLALEISITINVSEMQNHLAIRNTGFNKFCIVVPRVTDGGPTAGLGSWLERARTVAV